MRTVAPIAVFVALGITCTLTALADEQAKSASSNTQISASPADDFHFVDVLTLRGEIVNVAPDKLLVTIKDARGEASTFEFRDKKQLGALKAGDRVVVRYFEGAQIHKKSAGQKIGSLKNGLIFAERGKSTSKNQSLIASVEAVDAVDQEATLKASDGSLETILVTNPDKVFIRSGDRVAITHAEASVLSIEKDG